MTGFWNWFKRLRGFDPDAVHKIQMEEEKENQMYLYLDRKAGGRLIEAAAFGGIDAVRSIVSNEIEPRFLDFGGQERTISAAEHNVWANRRASRYLQQGITINRRTSSVVEESFLTFGKSLRDGFNIFNSEEHQICWPLNNRGGYGETLLHLCYLNASPLHEEIANLLLEMYPALAKDYYEGEEYYGESSLHLAIVYGNFDAVRKLVNNGADVNQRATGKFFLPEDIRKGTATERTTNYEGYAYYGEYPLAFAACFGHQTIYDFLLENGADPDLQDSLGNTVLHMVVINNRKEMYEYAMKHHLKAANQYVENHNKLTPLTLASKLGRYDIFKQIIELEKVELWRYSNIQCSVYSIAALDSIKPDGSTNETSALVILLDGETEEHLDMLDGGVIRQLLEEKWDTFIKTRFFWKLILCCLHFLLLMIAIYTRPYTCSVYDKQCLIHCCGAGEVSVNLIIHGSKNKEEPQISHVLSLAILIFVYFTDGYAVIKARFSAEIGVCLSCVLNIVFQLQEIKLHGFHGWKANLKNAPALVVYLFSCILILTCVPFRFLGMQLVEVHLLSVALPASWAYLLFFARGVKLTGPFVTMIYKMITGDLVRFGVIYLIFLIGFASGFFYLFKDTRQARSAPTSASFATPITTIMTLFQMTLGDIKYDEFGKTAIVWLTKMVFVIFMVLMPILLLNMLIAMMGNTYHQVITRSTKEWRRQWAKLVVVLERGFPKRRLKEFQAEYAIKMAAPSQADEEGKPVEQMGLLVVRALNKTKARQRKGAVSNWKKFGRTVLNLVKDHHAKGRPGCFSFDKIDYDKRKQAMSTETDNDAQENLNEKPSLFVTSELTGLSGGGLASALEQLAWEKDINLNASTVNMNETPSTPRIELNGTAPQLSANGHIVRAEPELVNGPVNSFASNDNKKVNAQEVFTIPLDTAVTIETDDSKQSSSGKLFGKRTATVAPIQLNRQIEQIETIEQTAKADSKESTETNTTDV